jgi:pimeloyl-ACP methyl ester carboxylesterase
MDLFYRKLGSGPPVIILHGLYGSSDNWITIGRELAGEFSVYLVDQRNHGQSPHDPVHNYQVLSEDIKELMNRLQIPSAYIIGHSMGGKTAMKFGINYPERIIRMVVVDISPLSYDRETSPPEITMHERIINGLQSLHPETLSSREEADNLLKKYVSADAIRQFLLKNLKRKPEGGYLWNLNLMALSDNLDEITAGVIDEKLTNPSVLPSFPLLFIRGALSGYIGSHDLEAIGRFFPWAEVITVPEAGHWVHAEKPDNFLEIIRKNFSKQGTGL